MVDVLELQLQWRRQRRPHALATVIEILGSSSAKPSAKALFDDQGRLCAGWIGGGCAQAIVAQAALACLKTGEPTVIDIDLNDEIFGAGMPCGGEMRVYVEPMIPKPRLWLAGHGRIVESLCALASHVGFDVVVDDALAKESEFPRACEVISDDSRYQALQPAAGDFVVIATHHKGDYNALTRALDSDAAYIALVSSQQRAGLVLKRLAQDGIDDRHLARIRAPAGLDLGARLPEEIALAIVSEMVMVRRGGSGRVLSRDCAV